MNLVCYLILLVSFVLNGVSTQQGPFCTTPGKRRGTCINIMNCPPLIALLQHQRPPPTDVVDYLRQSQCGYDGRTPRVCCPTESAPPVPLHTNVQQPNVADVSNHPQLRNLLPVQSCGILGGDNRISMGEVASLFEFPWMALISYRKGQIFDFLCGGSLINHRYVLTAAHCLNNPNGFQLAGVRLGEYNRDTERDCQYDLGCAPPVIDVGIEQVIIHPEYNKPKLMNDIGLIRMDRHIQFSDAVNPICLPIGEREQLNRLEGQKAIVTGWGLTEDGAVSSALLKVTVPIASLEMCSQIYNSSAPIGNAQICAGGVDKRDSCPGDSGGPLQTLGERGQGPIFIQFGIVSFGPRRCGSPGFPGVYTKVGHYMQWILDSMRY